MRQLLLLALATTLARPAVAAAVPREERLAAFLCALQPKLRWKRGREWTPAVCAEAAKAYIANGTASPSDTDVHDLLGVAVSIQESDLVDTATRQDDKHGKHDSGLMGVRYPSVITKGVKPKDLLKIPVNIRLGMTELRNWKTDEVMETVVVQYRGKDGSRQFKAVQRIDTHATHGWINHFNNGSRVSKDKFKASYGRRVTTIYLAICEALGEDPWELRSLQAGARDHRTKELVAVIAALDWPDPHRAALVTVVP